MDNNLRMFYDFSLVLFLLHVLGLATQPATTMASPSDDLLLPFCKLEDHKSFPAFLDCVGRRRIKRYSNNHHNRYPHREDYGHPCHSYVELNEPRRRVTNRINSTEDRLCDRNLRRRWYRFSSMAGGVMPETCVDEFSCGTHSPIWLNGQHPTRHGEIVDREVCASLNGRCCTRRWYIRVANCGDFYSYLLTDSPGCYMSYCAGIEMPCPPGQSSPTGFYPGCSGNFPQLGGTAVLRLSGDDSSVKFFCDYEGTIARETVIDVDWFVQGDKFDRRNYGDVPVWTDEMVERRRSVLTEGYWEGKLGSSIFCRMRARWLDQEDGVQSPLIESEKFFAGVKVLQRVVNVSESGPEGVIQIRSTIPVSCLPQFKDSCKVSIEVAHDSNWQEKQCVSGKMRQVVFGDCHIDLTPDNWNQTHNVTVKAVRDFYRDGNKVMRVGFKPIFTTFASDFWNDYRLPDVEVVANDAPAQMCSSTGDPHYTTFDGMYYHVYLEGEFVLYKNTRYPLQINTRLEQCGKVVSCNCGVAVIADDDVIVIDRCHRQTKNHAAGKSFPDGWNTIHRHALEQGDSFVDGLKLYEHDDGRRYTIRLPTGAYIDFHVGENWINLFLHGSSDDWKQTLGLCGTFDGNPNNDFLFPDEMTQTTPRHHESCGNSSDVCRFAEAWRVPDSESLFKEHVQVPAQNGRRRPFINDRYCKCEERSGDSTVVCNFESDKQNCEQDEELENAVERTDSVMLRSRRRMKRSELYVDQGMSDYFDSSFVYDENFKGREPKWPTLTGITESYARTRCYHALVQNDIGTTCYRHIYDDINRLIDACMVDVRVTDSFAWLQSSLDTMVTRCVNRIHDDGSLWLSAPPPPTLAPSNLTSVGTVTPSASTTRQHPATIGASLLNNVCPSACSQKGHCVRRKCHCSTGYTGVDCSTKVHASPQITFLSDGALCDVEVRPCHKIAVYGKNFRHSSPIHCHFREMTNAHSNRHTTVAVFETFEEVICPLPKRGFGDERPTEASVDHRVYWITLEQGGLKSEEHLLATFDSKCQHCEIRNKTYECSLKSETCLIGGRCYSNGEKDPEDCCQACDASQTTTSFVPATGLGELVLQPSTTSHRVAVGQFWQQTIFATGSCRFTYQVISHSEKRGLEFAASDSGVHFSVVSTEERVYAFEVKAVDMCTSVTTSKNYSVAFVSGPAAPADPLCVADSACGRSGVGQQHDRHRALQLVVLVACMGLALAVVVDGNESGWISILLALVTTVTVVTAGVVGTFRCSVSAADARPPAVAASVLDLTAVQGQLMTFQVEVRRTQSRIGGGGDHNCRGEMWGEGVCHRQPQNDYVPVPERRHLHL